MVFRSVISSLPPSSLADNDGSRLIPEDHKELMGGKALVQSVGIYRTPIENNPAFLHDFLMIEVRHVQLGTKKSKKVRYIRAEKGRNEEGRGEISLSYPDDIPEGAKEKHIRELEGCGEIQWTKLISILRAPRSHYSLLENNCWKCADETYRKLIEEFANLPDTKLETKGSLKKYLAGLPRLRLPADGFHVRWQEVLVLGISTALEEISAILLAVPGVVGLGSHTPLAMGAAASAGHATLIAKSGAIFTKIGLKPLAALLLKTKFLVLGIGHLKAISLGVGFALSSPHVLGVGVAIFLGTLLLGLSVFAVVKFGRGALGGVNLNRNYKKFRTRFRRGTPRYTCCPLPIASCDSH